MKKEIDKLNELEKALDNELKVHVMNNRIVQLRADLVKLRGEIFLKKSKLKERFLKAFEDYKSILTIYPSVTITKDDFKGLSLTVNTNPIVFEYYTENVFLDYEPISLIKFEERVSLIKNKVNQYRK